VFYPFKEKIKNELNNIHLEKYYNINTDENRIKDLLISVFQLMYYKLGDTRKARLLYNQEDSHLTESEFYCFELTRKRKQFLDIIFNSNPPGMYKFDTQNQQLADTLHISFDFLKLTDNFRTKLINYLKTTSQLPTDQKVYIE
jgi:hypothetical protein